MIRFNFKRGLRFRELNTTWTLVRRSANNRLILENEEGDVKSHSEDEILKLWLDGRYSVDEKSVTCPGDVIYHVCLPDISHYPQNKQIVAEQRYSIVREVLANTNNSKNLVKIRLALPLVATKLKLANIPASITVYRWIKKWRKERNLVCLIDRRRRSGRKSDRDEHEVFLKVLDEEYLDKQRLSTTEFFDRLKHQINRINSSRENSEIIKCPSKSTVYRWISQLEQDILDKARFGSIGEQKYRSAMGGVDVKYILERVEIDHTPLDMLIFDDKTNLPLGRPWITFAIDRFTRVILGFYVSFHAPSAMSVLYCLKHAILPKQSWRADNPIVHSDWPSFGLPAQIAVDNGMELHSNALQTLCAEMGIEVLFCPAKKPQYKGAIERFFRTLNKGLIHMLPGTVFSSPNERGDYPSEKVASISFVNFTQIITKWIVDIYHQTPHRGHGLPPLAKWNDEKNTRPAELPANPNQLDIHIGIPAQRTLFHYGIEFDGLKYNSDQLQAIRRSQGENIVVDIKYYDSIEYIYVLDPRSNLLFRVNAVNQVYANGLLRVTHEKIREQIKERRGEVTNSEQLLQSKMELQELIEQSTRSKKMKDRKNSARHRSINSETTMNRPIVNVDSKPIFPQIDTLDYGMPPLPQYEVHDSSFGGHRDE